MVGPSGTNLIVLHGHLPWVHHPAHDDFLEEDWIFEAVRETYLPLLAMLERLRREEVPVRLAVGLTPPLLEMLRAPALRTKIERHLGRFLHLAESEVRRLVADPAMRALARHYVEAASSALSLWHETGGDLVRAFRRHQDEGRIEILASSATHAVLPLVNAPELRELQIRIGVALYREAFGQDPVSFWLPECAYQPGLGRVLAAQGLRATILESHGVTGARPRPAGGVYQPLRLPGGVVAFGRDPASSRQVWAQEVGYPGDPHYRELYRDLGYDGDYETIRRWLHRDGVRRNLGIKYHRVTGKVELHEKEPYDVAAARARARVHAGNYIWNRGEQARGLARELALRPVICSPYDLELFGHWWYEGPWFLEDIYRLMADPETRAPVRLATPSDLLREKPPAAAGEAPLSTWGEGGFLKVWLNEKNSWVLRHQQELERRMLGHAGRAESEDAFVRRLLDQMLRELLLVQASDWAFILTKETSTHYARKRVTDHVSRFLRMEAMLEGRCEGDASWLEAVEAEDSIFPGLAATALHGGPLTRAGRSLGHPGP
jgi:1,4-alpha-glucan branching enzyme